MPQQIINIGAVANDGTGDTWRDAMDKANDNFTELYELSEFQHRVVVNELADFPAPVSNVITLAPETQYLIANDIALGDNRFVLSDLTSVTGIESISVDISSTTTGDLFTGTNVTARVSDLTLSCPNGRIFNWSETTGKVFRANDLSITACNKVALFTGTTGVIRFTNVSPSSITSDGIQFSGNFRSFLYDVSASAINAGALFNLGSATFDSFIIETILVTLNGTSNLLSGATASANINSGGNGLVSRMRISGTGTPLVNITVSDARWEFRGNDDLPDTRPDGLLSMQSNATTTTISVAGTYVLVAGTWVVERTSQMTGTTGGRLTYNGGKDATLPITFSCTVEPASGVNKSISIRVAKNGTTIANSTRTVSADAGAPVNVSAIWQDSLSTNDFIEVFVTNNTDTIAVLVSSAIARIN